MNSENDAETMLDMAVTAARDACGKLSEALGAMENDPEGRAALRDLEEAFAAIEAVARLARKSARLARLALDGEGDAAW